MKGLELRSKSEMWVFLKCVKKMIFLEVLKRISENIMWVFLEMC